MVTNKNPQLNLCIGRCLVLVSLILALPAYCQFPFPPGFPEDGSEFVIPDDIGGLPGFGALVPAPDCPADTGSLPLPKTVSVCGSGLSAWELAAVFPAFDGNGYMLSGFAGALDSLVRLDSEGYTVAKTMALDGDTTLNWLPDLNLVNAHRFSDTEDGLIVGVYYAGGEQALYEKTLSLSGTNAFPNVLSNGGMVIVQDLSTEISVVVLSPAGELEWAKRYSSSVFGVDDGIGGGFGFGGFGFGPRQLVSLDELTDGYLLNVTKAESPEGGFGLPTTHTVALVRLDALGAVMWARSYTGMDTFAPPMVSNTREGPILLTGFDMQTDAGPGATQSSLIVSLDAQGIQRWGKRIAQANIGSVRSLPDDRFFFSGAVTSGDGQASHSLFGIFDSNGNIHKQILVSAGDLTFGVAIPGQDRILYTLLAGEQTLMGIDPQQIAVIGTSDLELNQWQWRQFIHPTYTATLMPNDNGTGLLFSAFDNENRSFDIVTLGPDLTSDAPCELFLNTDVAVRSDVNLVPSAFSVTSTNVTVNASNDTPQFGPGHIALQTFNCIETPICQ
jgi:hypothetical protein